MMMNTQRTSKNNFLTTHYPKIVPLPGDATKRCYYRIYDKEGKSAMLTVTHLDSPDTFNHFLEVQNLLKKRFVPVPDVLFSDPKELYLLQTDLGDTRMYDQLQYLSSEQIESLYKKAIDLLVLFQKKTSVKASITAYKQSFDYHKLSWEVGFTNQHFLTSLLSLKKESHSTKIMNFLTESFHQICLQISQLPYILTHRDYHSKNLMLHKNKLFLIDFQDARMGPTSYDLVSLLRDAYFPLDEKLHTTLIRYYYQQAISLQNFIYIFPSESHFIQQYHLVSLQRLYKVIGSFAFIYKNKNDKAYLDYLNTALNKLKAAVSFFPQYDNLYSTLIELKDQFSALMSKVK